MLRGVSCQASRRQGAQCVTHPHLPRPSLVLAFALPLPPNLIVGIGVVQLLLLEPAKVTVARCRRPQRLFANVTQARAVVVQLDQLLDGILALAAAATIRDGVQL